MEVFLADLLEEQLAEEAQLAGTAS